MKTEVHVDSDGMLVLVIRQPGRNTLTESKYQLTMHLSEATVLAEQIRSAMSAFPPSSQDSPAWVAAN